MKIKGIKKVCGDSKLLNGNNYLQVCFDGDTQTVFAVWHTGYYVNTQTHFASGAIHTICNLQSYASQKYIRFKLFKKLGFFRSEFVSKEGYCFWDDADFIGKRGNNRD